MELLKELDQKAKTIDLEILLESLEKMGADLTRKATSVIVLEGIEHLKEVGRGDYQAHMDMARARGVQGSDADPRVTGALRNPRLHLQQKMKSGKPPVEPTPKQRVTFASRHGHAEYEILSIAGDDVILKDPRGERYVVNKAHLKVAEDPKGNIVGWSAQQQPAPRKSRPMLQGRA